MPVRLILLFAFSWLATWRSRASDLPPALAWQSGTAGASLSVQPAGNRAGFTEMVPADLGIRWTNRLSDARYGTRQNLMNGAGVALADFDGDGWCDLFLVNKEGPSALFRNLGNWRFTNVTERAGLTLPQFLGTGALFGDVNGDGRPDLFVTSFLGPDALFLNLGDGRFTNVTTAAGVASKGGTTSAAAADVDGDGDLDLYVCHFGVEAILRDGAAITTRNVGGRPVVSGRFAKRIRIVDGQMIEYGEPDVLFLNDGPGVFRPAPAANFSDESGRPLSEMPPDFGLAVQIRDLDGNGTPDIYVCNDFHTPDRVWFGDGQGRFRAAPKTAFRNMSYASMGVDAADLDRDGHLDLFTVEMLSRDHARHLAQRSPIDPAMKLPGDEANRGVFARNVLQWNRGDGTYAEIAWFAGLAMSDWSWTPIFMDVDLDGYQDLLVSNGHLHDVNDLDINASRSTDPAKRSQENARDLLLRYPRLAVPKAAWRNRRDLTFEDVSKAWHFDSTLIAHGMALADLDNDGDADVVASAWDSPPLIWRNESPAPRIAVRLKGRAPNTDAVGARVRVTGGPVPTQELEMLAGGRYLSSDHPQLSFATGKADKVAVEVRWPDGGLTALREVAPNRILRIQQPEVSTPSPAPAKPAARIPLLAAQPVPDSFRHVETIHDDFARQPNLPRRLSQLGPPLASFGSGTHLEVFLGPARGGVIRALRLGREGHAEAIAGPDPNPVADDVVALLAVQLSPGVDSLFASLSHYEGATSAPPTVLRYDRDRASGVWRPGPALKPAEGSNPGPLAAADLDGDGLSEVIVAGRFVPGRYPEPAGTRVFRNDSSRPGQLVVDEGFSRALDKVGLVTGLGILDFDGDGRLDLALSCEWGAVRLFRNEGAFFRERTAESGLAPFTGRWQCLAVGDFDRDGKPDLIAGNWGRNSHQQRSPEGPWELWYGDFDGSGRVSLVEAQRDPARGRMMPVRSREVLAADLGWLTAAFPLHKDYAEADLPKILGTHAKDAHVRQATSLESSVFLNRGGKFERHALPPQAQWTPINALASADFDGDGNLDVVAAQNMFAVRNDDDPIDAGTGLVLLGDGKGNFRSLLPEESGLRVLGGQTAALTLAFPTGGRPGLALGENSGPLRVYLARP